MIVQRYQYIREKWLIVDNQGLEGGGNTGFEGKNRLLKADAPGEAETAGTEGFGNLLFEIGGGACDEVWCVVLDVGAAACWRRT